MSSVKKSTPMKVFDRQKDYEKWERAYQTLVSNGEMHVSDLRASIVEGVTQNAIHEKMRDWRRDQLIRGVEGKRGYVVATSQALPTYEEKLERKNKKISEAMYSRQKEKVKPTFIKRGWLTGLNIREN